MTASGITSQKFPSNVFTNIVTQIKDHKLTGPWKKDKNLLERNHEWKNSMIFGIYDFSWPEANAIKKIKYGLFLASS